MTKYLSSSSPLQHIHRFYPHTYRRTICLRMGVRMVLSVVLYIDEWVGSINASINMPPRSEHFALTRCRRPRCLYCRAGIVVPLSSPHKSSKAFEFHRKFKRSMEFLGQRCRLLSSSLSLSHSISLPQPRSFSHRHLYSLVYGSAAQYLALTINSISI